MLDSTRVLSENVRKTNDLQERIKTIETQLLQKEKIIQNLHAAQQNDDQNKQENEIKNLRRLLQNSEENEKLLSLQLETMNNEFRYLQTEEREKRTDFQAIKNMLIKFMEADTIQNSESLFGPIANMLAMKQEDIERILQARNKLPKKRGFFWG
eukprot:TRINITY_DN2630_c0_g1_i1.p1 TRINITY_DN2630_c0_g1~~TRINITY_DN2630_c0_g1_i1.p1  ORF type:complete len:154 (-),score=73.33 TRINITY_DN2630_c0_g1_i1:82-543(-)